MKNFKIYITMLSTVAMIFQSCSLDEEVFGKLNEENFYKTAADAEAGLVYAYSVLPTMGYYSRHFFYSLHQTTEEFTQKSDASQDQKDLDGLAQSETNGDTKQAFRHAYIGINRAIAIIENVPNITMDTDLRNQYVGEGYFLRALNYYNLVRLFGAVPLRLTSLQGLDDAHLPLASIEEIYASIISDLRKAESMMDYTRRRGRANKVAAQGLLANAYLFMASAGQNTDKLDGYQFATANTATYYDSAAYFAGNVINDQSTYSFNSDLVSMYNSEVVDEPESIFEVIASRTEIGESATDLAGTLTTPYFDQQSATLSAEQGGYEIGFGWQHVFVEVPFYDTFDNADVRKNILFATSAIAEDGQEWSVANGKLDRPFTLKYLDAGRSSGVEISGNKYHVVRFSEVLLTYAEAVGPTAEGYAAVNQVRSRAGLPNLAGGMDVNTFREAIYQERTWELAYEFQHLFDLRRLGKMETVLEGQYAKTIVRNAYYYALPDVELDQNDLLGTN
ncbi:MAG: RagB/SusD family nutrient uptake outer membrane protein [Reichenbachiella sp.]|uniref:RagB/SusD family nutrient uptake outer membrane protein n=1 Tax=Reichenbachiella sp. TaxID=2184521 RepID=UPI0032663C40